MSKYDDIKIPESLKRVRNSAIEKAYKDKKFKRDKKRFTMTVSIAIIGLGLLGIGVSNPTFAQKILRVNEMIQAIQGIFTNNELSDSITTIGESSTRDGLTITVQNAYYSQNEITLEIELKTDKPFKNTKYSKVIVKDNKDESIDDFALMTKDFNTWINGEETKGIVYESPRFKYIDEYTLKGYWQINFKSPIENHKNYDTIKMSFGLNETNYDKKSNNYKYTNSINGPWILEFPVKSNMDKVKIIKPDIRQDIITVKQVTLSQTSLNLKLELEKQGVIEYVEVKDDNGETLGGGMESSNPNKIDLDFGLKNVNQSPKYITIFAYGNIDNGKDESKAIKIKINLE
ncbi:DUF4179 domain-containing protein [Clostridioides difficile]|uniref:DUF4179 domain-containing protein n=1 Tax=Clostridioides difficile TaxID=1496 RepID=UPI00017F533D|nr:DUF4179 domain-containing protein [Clostridioides difficile]MDN9316771.1 DUF4179 domain-containing protein [Clostridioides difficile]